MTAAWIVSVVFGTAVTKQLEARYSTSGTGFFIWQSMASEKSVVPCVGEFQLNAYIWKTVFRKLIKQYVSIQSL